MSSDLDRLQGSWAVTRLEMDGEAMPGDMIENARVVIEGKRFTSVGMGADYQGILSLDATKNPGHIDMKFEAGPESGNTNLGIYEIAGDGWKMCLATSGAVRPRRFVSSPGSGFAYQTFARQAAPLADKKKARLSKKAAPAVRNMAPATEFEGEWIMVSGVMNGRAMEESLVKWVKRTFEGNQTAVYAGPRTMLKAEFTHDAAASPATIDYRNLGPDKGKIQFGIYERTGDLLTVCVAASGHERPAEFQSNPGDGRTLTVWKKA